MPLRPRYLVLDEGEALTRLLTRHLPQAEIVPVGSLAEAQRLLVGEAGEALLINDESVGEGLRRLAQAGGLPVGAPAIVCSVPGRARSLRGAGCHGATGEADPPRDAAGCARPGGGGVGRRADRG